MKVNLHIDGVKPQTINRPLIAGAGFGPLPLPVVLYADGTALSLTTDGDTPTLEELQAAVGGYVEFVPVPAMDGITMVVDEDGLPKAKPVNALASEIAMRPIVGDVVLVCGEDMEEQEVRE